MADLETLTGRLCYEYDASGMKAAMADMARAADALERMAEQTGKTGAAADKAKAPMGRFSDDLKQINLAAGKVQISTQKAGLALAGMGAAATLAIKGAVGSSQALEKQIKGVETLLGDTVKDIDAWEKQTEEGLLRLSRTLGQDVVVAAQAMYDAISSGIDQAKALDFMEVAGKASVAGMTDINTAVSGLTVALNSYNAGAQEAERYSDVMFQAVNLGVISYEELASAMGKVTGIAASVGVEYDEVAAAVAQITTKGYAGAEAVTAVRGSLVALLKGTPELEKAFEWAGVKDGQELLDELGYQGAMEKIREYADETGTSMVGMFGRVEGASAALALTGENAEGARQKLDSISNSAGATALAFDIMGESGAQKMAVLRESFNALKIGIGDALAPVVGILADGLKALVDGFDRLGPGAKTAAAVVLALAAVVGTLGGAALLAAGQLGPMILAVSGSATAMGALSAAAGVAAAALAGFVLPLAAIAGAALVVKNANDSFNDSLLESYKTIKPGTATLSAYAEQVRKTAADQEGLSGVIGRSNLRSEASVLQAGADAWLRYGLGVDEAVLSSDKFAEGLKKADKELEANLKSGMDAATAQGIYESALLGAASAASEAAGKGAVLSTSQQRTKQVAEEYAAALVDENTELGALIAKDAAYAAAVDRWTDNVANGTSTLGEMEANIRAVIAAKERQIEVDRESGQSLEDQLPKMQAYSDAMMQAAGGSLTGITFTPDALLDEEALADRAEAVGKINQDALQGYKQWGADWLQMEEDYAADLEKARQEDAAAAAAAARAAQEQRDKALTNQAEHANKVKKAQEGLAKAQEGGDTVGVAKYQEDLANLETYWATATTITATGASNKAAEVQAAYEAERAAQMEHLGQMALDQLNALMAQGVVAPQQAEMIYGAMAAALPDADLFAPADQAMFNFWSSFSKATTGGIKEAADFQQTFLDTPRLVQESADVVDEMGNTYAESFAQQAEAAGVAYTVIQTGAEDVAVKVDETTGRLVAAHAAAGESIQTLAETEGTAAADTQTALDETATTAEDTTERRVTASDSAAIATDEELSAYQENYGDIRTEYTNTGTTSATVTQDIRGNMQAVGEDAMGMGDNVTSGTATLIRGLEGVRDATKDLGTDVAAAAYTGSEAWIGEAHQISNAGQGIIDTDLEVQSSQQDVQDESVTRAETAKRTSKEEQDAYDDASKAADDHATESEDAYERVEDAAKDAQKQIKDYTGELKSVPRSVSTRVELQNYDRTFGELHTLLQMIAQATGQFTITIDGRYDPTTPGMPPGSPRFELSHWVDELRENAARGFDLEGRYDPRDTAMEPLHSLAIESWIHDAQDAARQGIELPASAPGWESFGELLDYINRSTFDLVMAVEALRQEYRGAEGDITAAQAALVRFNGSFDDATTAAGRALDEYYGEYLRFLDELYNPTTGEGENDTLDYFFAEWDRFTRSLQSNTFWDAAAAGFNFVADSARQNIQAIEQLIKDAIANDDIPEAQAQWQNLIKAITQAENERYSAVTAQLRAESRAAAGDADRIARIDKEIERERSRHEDFLATLTDETGALEDFYGEYERYLERQEELEAELAEARRRYAEELKRQQEQFEDYEDRLHDQITDHLDARSDAIEEQLDVELEAWDQRRDAAQSYHDEQMANLKAEEDGIKGVLDAQKEAIDQAKRDLDKLETLPWAVGAYAGWTMEDLEKAADTAADGLKDLKSAIDKLPKFDQAATKPQKKTKTGIEKTRVTDATLLSGLRAAYDAGLIADERLRAFAEIILAGGKLRADYIRELFDSIMAASETAAKKSPLQQELDNRNALLDQRKREIELAEILYDDAKVAADDQLDALADRKQAENDRYQDEIDHIADQRQAAEDYYQLQLDGIEAAQEAEDRRHDQRMRDIEEAYAMELMIAGGMTPDEAAAEVERRADEARRIADEALAKAQEVQRAGGVAAAGMAQSYRDRIAARRQQLGQGGDFVEPVFPGGGLYAGGGTASQGRGWTGRAISGGSTVGGVGGPGVEPRVFTDPIVAQLVALKGSADVVAGGVGELVSQGQSAAAAAQQAAVRSTRVGKRSDAKRLQGPNYEWYWTGELKPWAQGGLNPTQYGTPPGFPGMPNENIAPIQFPGLDELAGETDSVTGAFRRLAELLGGIVAPMVSGITSPSIIRNAAESSGGTMFVNYGTVQIGAGEGGSFEAGILDWAAA